MPRKTGANQISMSVIDLRAAFIWLASLCEEDIEHLDELLRVTRAGERETCVRLAHAERANAKNSTGTHAAIYEAACINVANRISAQKTD